jgi:hypothetical protein
MAPANLTLFHAAEAIAAGDADAALAALDFAVRAALAADDPANATVSENVIAAVTLLISAAMWAQRATDTRLRARRS